jgi:hypothetical protein
LENQSKVEQCRGQWRTMVTMKTQADLLPQRVSELSKNLPAGAGNNMMKRFGASRSASFVVGVLMASIIAGACGSKDSSGASSDKAIGSGGADELFAETASFETVQGKPQRVTFGISTVDGRILHGGSVFVAFRPVDDSGADTKRAGVAASYLAVAGPATSNDKPASIGALSDGVGVYSATFTFPKPGFWTAQIRQSKGGKVLAETAVDVKAKNSIPDVGDPAPATQNPVLLNGQKPSVPINRIDSRSGPDALAELADPALHTEVIADLLKAHRPFVVVVSTPAYCQSKFCGPITDLVDERAKTATATASDDGLAFVHLEVFANATENMVNKWAAEWILGDGEGREPWVFLVGRDGKIAARFDNVMTSAEFISALTKLN